MSRARHQGMHALFAGFKHAHWRSQRILRKLTAPAGLTPARFDLLLLLAQQKDNMRLQSALVEDLGVRPQTVSRMLIALEELGLVDRWPDWDECRTWRVTLTEDGFLRLWKAIEAIKD